MWEKFNGPIPEGFEIHHKDENKVNYNINNLELIKIKQHHKKHAIKNKLGQSNKGKPKNHISGCCTKKHPIIAEKDGVTLKFESICEACRELKVNSACVCKILKGERKTAKGWRFYDGV